MTLLENELYSVNYRGRSLNPSVVELSGVPCFISYNTILSRLEIKFLGSDTYRMEETDLAPGYFDDYKDPYTYSPQPTEIFINFSGWSDLDYMIVDDVIIVSGKYGANIIINTYNLFGNLLHTNTLTTASFPVLIYSQSEDVLYIVYFKSDTQMLYYRYSYDNGETWSGHVLITPLGQPIYELTADISLLKEGATEGEYSVIFAFRDSDNIKVYKIQIPHAYIGGNITLGGNPLSGVSVVFSHNGEVETTDANGRYFNHVISGTPTTITPEKYLYDFTPPNTFMTASDGTTSVDFEATYIGVTISGRIVDQFGFPVENVAVSFSNPSHIEYTDATGYYEYAVESGTTTTLTPSLSDYTFNPVNSTLVNVVAQQTVNFIALTDMVVVVGRVFDATTGDPLNDISIVFSHDGYVEHTNSNGYYRRLIQRGTNTILTPSFDYGLYTFDPGNSHIVNIQSTQVVDFLGYYIGLRIAGQIIDSTSGVPIENVEVTFTHNSHVEYTDATGNYSYMVPEGTTTTVIPVLTGYVFDPVNIVVTDISIDQDNVDFDGTPV